MEGKTVYNKDINWTTEANLHFTYQFIGDTREEDIPVIIDYLKNIAENTRSFELYDCELKWYPFKNSPLICLMYHFHNSYIIRQHHQLNAFLTDLSYPIEDRRLNFHLTLARLKKSFNYMQKNWNESLVSELHNIRVDKIKYYKSTLYAEGPVYECLAEFNLKGGQDVHR